GPPSTRPSSPSAPSSEEQSSATDEHGKTRIKQSQYKKLYPCQSVFIRGKKLSEEFEGHDEGVFAAVEGGVVARAAADLVEALAVVQRDRGGIGRAHLQEHALGAVAAGDLQQRAQQAAAVALALHLRRRAQVEDVRLARGDAEHRVAEDRTAPVQHPRRVAGTQAIAEDAARPRERIGATLHVHHRVEVVLAHRPQAGRRGPVGGKRAHPGARLSRRSAGHSARLAAGSPRNDAGGGQARTSSAASPEPRSRPAARNSASSIGSSGSATTQAGWPSAASTSRWNGSQ